MLEAGGGRLAVDAVRGAAVGEIDCDHLRGIVRGCVAVCVGAHCSVFCGRWMREREDWSGRENKRAVAVLTRAKRRVRESQTLGPK